MKLKISCLNNYSLELSKDQVIENGKKQRRKKIVYQKYRKNCNYYYYIKGFWWSFFVSFSFFFFLRFTQKVWRHLLKLSNADRVGGAAGSTLSQPSLFEVVEVRCSLVLVWCRLRVSHQRANAESQSEGEIEVEQGGNRGYYYFVNFGG